MLTRLRTALLLCLLSLCAFAAQAATLNVGPGQQYTTIQSAINAAAAGDTVLVAPGTYYENIDFKGKAITVTSLAGAATTIIDGTLGQTAVVSFQSKEKDTSILNGFTIRGGGQNVYVQYPSTAINAGIYILAGYPRITNNVITQNYCNGILSSGSSPLIQNNEVDNTLDQGRCGFAGGSAIWLQGSLNYYNAGTANNTSPARVVGNVIQNNTQSGRDDAGGNGGAAVAIWGADAYLASNTMRNNLTLGDGGAVLAFNTDEVVLIGNLIYGNKANYDGAVSLAPPDGTVGPFIGVIASNTIYGNHQTSTHGGSTSDTPPAQVGLSGNLGQYLLVNNIIVASSDPGAVAVGCGVSYSYLALTPLVFDHNDLYNPFGGATYGGSCPTQTGQYGNISSDPLFVDPANSNFQLMAGSPALDSGNSSAPMLTSQDLLGNPRIADSSGKGFPMIDMGAYERAGLQDAPITILLLTPSVYYVPNGYNPYSAPEVFTIQLASASGIPQGPVTLYEDGNSFATVNVGPTGIATSQPTLTPGLHAYTATFAGAAPYPPAVSVKFYLAVPLTQSSLKLTSSANPSILNSPVTFTVQTSTTAGFVPSPIQITDQSNNTPLATLTPNAQGIASFTTSGLSQGSHSLVASFAGDSTHATASSTLYQSVISGYPTTTTLTCNPNSISFGGTSLLFASVSSPNGAVTGTVAFTDNGAPLGQPALVNGNTSLTYTGNTAGSHIILATAVPTGAYSGSTATCTIAVNLKPTMLTLTTSQTPANYATPVTFTATATYQTQGTNPAGLGTITFSDGATPLQTVTLGANSTATYTTNSLTAGKHTINATLNPIPGYSPSVASIAQVITGYPSTSTFLNTPTQLTYGAPFVLAAGIASATSASTATPTGTVQFFLDGVQTGPPATLAQGTTSQSVAGLISVGSHQLACFYSGDTTYGASACGILNLNITQAPTTTSLVASPLTAYVGQPITFTAAVSATNNVPAHGTLNLGGVRRGSPVAATSNSGSLLYTTTALTPGTLSYNALYLGDTTTGASTSSVASVTILANTSTTTLSVTPSPGYQGQPITLTALVANSAGLPMANLVTFFDGSQPLGAYPVANNRATLTTTQLAPGTHTLTAIYAGDATSPISTSLAVSETILQSDFTFTATPGTLSLGTGHHTTFTLTAASGGAFSGQLGLSVDRLPNHAFLDVKQPILTLTQGGQAVTSVYLDTDDVIGYLSTNQPRTLPLTALLFLPLAAVFSKRRRRLPTLLLLALAACLLTAATGCSGKYPASVAPGSYTLRITATSPQTGIAHTAEVPLLITE